MIRIVIADDHPIVRQGLRFFLEQQPDVSVVGESSDGKETVEVVASTLPTVLLLDLLMPTMDGVQAIRQIKRISPATHILVVTSYYDDEHIFRAIKAGALSYLLKESDPQELIAAVRAAAKGESTLHPLVAKRLLRELSQSQRTEISELTPRELEVLTYLARGRSNQIIAQGLVISEETVKTHVSNILSKLHLADRTQAAIYALQQRLVPLDDALEKNK